MLDQFIGPSKLRERLHATLGPRLARKVLARRFPGGTAKPEIESRVARIEETGGGAGSMRSDVLGELDIRIGMPLSCREERRGYISNSQMVLILGAMSGPAELWAFSTTAEDVALRERLYGTLGPRLARKVLARRFPGGTARPDIESRTARIEETGRGAGSGRDVIGELVDELTSAAYLLVDRG